MRAIRWYVVPGVWDIPFGDGSSVSGYRQGNRIVLAGNVKEFGDVVRHEMLHALVRVGGHPRSMFIQRCGGVVDCIDSCISDGGLAPPPDPNAVRADPSVLSVSVSVDPKSPGSGTDDGHFRMVITVRNPTTSALDVQLPPSGDAGPPGTFSYRISNDFGGSSYDMRWHAPEDARFAPLETKRFIFDKRNRQGPLRYDLGTGSYVFEGAYGEVWAKNPPMVYVAP